MITRRLSIVAAMVALLTFLSIPPGVAHAATDAQFKQIRICYARATLYEVFATRYIKGYTRKQSINFVKSVDASQGATKQAIRIVKTTYSDKPEKKFSYALGKLKQCNNNNIPIVTDRISALCYSLKGLAEVINTAKRNGKSYDQTMAMIDNRITNKTAVALARSMGKTIYKGQQSITSLQRSYYLGCVKTALEK